MTVHSADSSEQGAQTNPSSAKGKGRQTHVLKYLCLTIISDSPLWKRGDWAKFTFAKTSRAVTRDNEKNWPIADRLFSSNDPRKKKVLNNSPLLETRRKLDRVYFRKDFWGCYQGQQKNCPIADQRVSSNDPSKPCKSQLGPVSFSFLKGQMYKKYDCDCFETRGVFERRTSTGSEDFSLLIWDQFRCLGKLPTYPSPKLTLTLTSCLGPNDGLGEG